MELERFMVTGELSIIKVMEHIDKNGRGIAFVCDAGILRAAVSDGDIRRHILRGGDLQQAVNTIANHKPLFVLFRDRAKSDALMKARDISVVPVVDSDMRLREVRLAKGGTVTEQSKLDVPVVIMAGGKGTRLFPYTQILPKPLIPIGEKTITEHIMDKFERFGCSDFNMIVNYKKALIKAFFQDSDQCHTVRFTEESKFMGTGGGLRLLLGQYDSTFFMANCDTLIDDDYSAILKQHKEQNNILTMVCATKMVTIPYGTVVLKENGMVGELTEKPSYSFLTNVGFYVIEPRFLDRIPEDTFIHITDLIQSCMDDGENIGVYPISEYAWMDMGQFEEMERMRERLEF